LRSLWQYSWHFRYSRSAVRNTVRSGDRIRHALIKATFRRRLPSYRYRIERFDPDHHRFWVPGGFYFEVAPWDWPICADWCWDCADDFAIYEDTDHPGWYLLYNVHTGICVHVNYMGT
jgi:hypothetical protein